MRVEENGRDIAAQSDTTETLVRHKRNVLTRGPNHAVGGRFAAGTGAHHVAHISHQMAFFLQVFNELHGAAFAVFFGLEGRAFAGVFQHRQIVQRNVGAAPSVGGRRQIVSVGFASHLEHGDRDFWVYFVAAGEPLGIRPALHHVFGFGVTGFGFVGHIVEEVKHQQGFLQRVCGHTGHFSVVEQFDEGVNVVAAHHGAQQLGGFGLGNQTHFQFAMRHSR